VIHTAFPKIQNNTQDKRKKIGFPIINTIRNLLNACLKNNVKKVVMTSSYLTIGENNS